MKMTVIYRSTKNSLVICQLWKNIVCICLSVDGTFNVNPSSCSAAVEHEKGNMSGLSECFLVSYIFARCLIGLFLN